MGPRQWVHERDAGPEGAAGLAESAFGCPDCGGAASLAAAGVAGAGLGFSPSVAAPVGLDCADAFAGSFEAGAAAAGDAEDFATWAGGRAEGVCGVS
ncbi:MAG: hypothetical protein HY000_30725 [Planctomycetes bacterium]|nr:hypothetical protein [Planctomycetota bacterium]